jgi:hypothetical protein
MTYAGSPLCAAVNALLRHVDGGAHKALFREIFDPAYAGSTIETIAADLRRAHNSALFAEANLPEFPGTRMTLDAPGKDAHGR